MSKLSLLILAIVALSNNACPYFRQLNDNEAPSKQSKLSHHQSLHHISIYLLLFIHDKFSLDTWLRILQATSNLYDHKLFSYT